MLQLMENGEFYLIDLGSRNGSFVNSRRVSIPVTLQHGDQLTFGQTELEFYCPSQKQHALEDGELNRAEKDFTATATLHVRRLISVLVVDIRNFTVLTRQLDEKILSEMIGTWFRHAGDIIREHGSWVDKYIGDAVMAVWIHGTQEVKNDDMLQIMQALGEMHKMTSDLYNLYPLPFPLRIGAGINTGYAMVGNTGSGDRPDYTALGDTVNAAFRLETSTKQIGKDVAVGKTTFQYIENLGVEADVFGQYNVNLRGYDAPAEAYACSFVDLETFLKQKNKAL